MDRTLSLATFKASFILLLNNNLNGNLLQLHLGQVQQPDIGPVLQGDQAVEPLDIRSQIQSNSRPGECLSPSEDDGDAPQAAEITILQRVMHQNSRAQGQLRRIPVLSA